jgi:hypothetical protein
MSNQYKKERTPLYFTHACDKSDKSLVRTTSRQLARAAEDREKCSDKTRGGGQLRGVRNVDR